MTEVVGVHPDRARLQKEGIGASQIGAVAGVSKYGAYEVWEQILGLAEPFADNHHTLRGKFLEPGIRKWLAHDLGIQIKTMAPVQAPGSHAALPPRTE